MRYFKEAIVQTLCRALVFWLAVLVFVTLFGCGRATDPSDSQFLIRGEIVPEHKDADLVAIVDQWNAIFTARGVGLGAAGYVREIAWADGMPGADVVGLCKVGRMQNPINHVNKGSRSVTVKSDMRTDPRLYWIVGHELGHCYFGLDHTESPSEVMSAELLVSAMYVWHGDEMTDRFIAQIKEVL